MALSRRRFLSLGAGGLLAACGTLAVPSRPVTVEDGPEALAARMVSGGQLPEAIPAIDGPQYESVREADRLLDDGAVVDGLELADVAIAYPRLFTVWHEIVNEEIGGQPITFTYCPLTGSSVLFAGDTGDGQPATFGTSGKLLNSNLVMRDRVTGSSWSQLLGLALDGQLAGRRLREFPVVVTTTYGRWKRRHPSTLVLTPRTGLGGFSRPYGSWPYGDYDTNDRILFPVEARDARFHPKRVVVGARLGADAIAIANDEFLARDRVLDVELSSERLALVPDVELGAVRAFRTRVRDANLHVMRSGAGLVDDETRTRWNLEGLALEGPLSGSRLRRLNAFDVQWFAWYAFYPRTLVLA